MVAWPTPGRNIWRANVGTGIDTRQLYVNGAIATRARTTLNRSDFTATSTGLRFTNSALSYLNNLANQNRIQMESVNSFTDRYVVGAEHQRELHHDAAARLEQQQLRVRHASRSPHRAGPLYLDQRLRVPRLGRASGTSTPAPAPCTTSRCPGRT